MTPRSSSFTARRRLCLPKGIRLSGCGRRFWAGYTLVEVMAAAMVVGVAISAAVSMASTMALQEELSWRVAVAMNYQENACRLWQLGLSPADVTTVLPDVRGNPFLNEILDSSAATTAGVTSNASGLGVLESATNTLRVANYSSADLGSSTPVSIYRNVTRGSAYEP